MAWAHLDRELRERRVVLIATEHELLDLNRLFKQTAVRTDLQEGVSLAFVILEFENVEP